MTIWPFSTFRRLKAQAAYLAAENEKLWLMLEARIAKLNAVKKERDAALAELAKPHPSTQAQHRAREAMRDYVNAELAGTAR